MFFFFYLILSFVFFKERLFSDSAYYLANMIGLKSFALAHGRYSPALTQILTLVSVLFNLPIKYIAIIHSLSSVIYYYIIFLVILYCFKNIPLSLGIPFIMLLDVRHTFFWPVSEISLSLAISLLLLAFIQKLRTSKNNSVIKNTFLVILLLINLNFHTVSVDS